jgi:hypothetical protein
LATIPLKLASLGKRGLVRVLDEKGNILRDTLITGEQVAAWHLAGKYTTETHIGVTQEEWESGRAAMYGIDLEPGDVLIDGDVALVQTGERYVGNELVREFVKMEKGEWAMTETDLILSDTALAAAGVSVVSLEVV